MGALTRFPSLPSTRVFASVCLGAFVILIIGANVLASAGGGTTAFWGKFGLALVLAAATAFWYSLLAVGIRVLGRAFAALARLASPQLCDGRGIRGATDVIIIALWAVWTVGLVVAARSPMIRLILGW